MSTPSKIRTWWMQNPHLEMCTWTHRPIDRDDFPLVTEQIKVVAVRDLEPLLEALREANDALGGMCHTNFPINVRELDRSISQVRPESSAGRAYKITKAALAIWDGAGE